jgi:peptidoglycan/xylan/chitin deacetylase (PgdA/CDA1 family)
MKYLRSPSRHRRWLLPAVGMLVVLPLIAVGMIRAGSAHSANAPTVVSIEFDDGYSDQYQALSMLSAHNMHATFFINSGSPGQQNYMTWSQLHDLTSAGNEIGGHTVSQ